MASLNRWEGIGRLGNDPEVRNMDNGNKVANISMAVTDSYKDKSGVKKEVTEWITLALWNGLAEVAEKYLHKGDQIFAAGKLRTRTWEKDGTTRYITEIQAESIIMLGASSRTTPAARPAVEAVNGNSTEDLPF